MLSSSASAKNLLDRVLDVALMRSHDFLNASGRAPKSAVHITFDNAPLPLSVENGVDGALENVFWVTLESVPMKTCAELLKEKQKLQNSTLPLIDISVNGSITQNCVDTNEIKFFFQKDRRISTSSSSLFVTPRQSNEEDDGNVGDEGNGEIEGRAEDKGSYTTCPTITCPTHATCSNGTVRCQAGYFKNESGTCSPCSEGAYSAEGATSCMTCGDGTVNADHTTCECYQNATKDDNGTCACNTSFF